MAMGLPQLHKQNKPRATSNERRATINIDQSGAAMLSTKQPKAEINAETKE